MRAKLGKYLLGGILVLIVWTGIVAGLAFFASPGANVAVFTRPGQAAEVAVAAGGSLEEFSSMLVITRSAEPGFTLRLYQAGALLVIDARVVSGCRAVFNAGRRTLSLR